MVRAMTGPSGARVLLRNLLGSVTVFILFLGVAELGLRLADVAAGRGFNWHARNLLLTQRPAVPFRMFGFDPYAETESGLVISSRWQELYPLAKPPGAFRIICFGGSTTENRVEEMHYPLRLQQLMRERHGRDDIEVINVANQAYSTPHSLILLQLHALHWQPDLIILSHNVNDLTAAYFPDFRSDYSNKYSNEFFLPGHQNVVTTPNVLFQQSQLYWFVVGRYAQLETKRRPRTPIRRRSYGRDPPREAVEVFEHNLRTFVELAQAREIPVLLASQPFSPAEEMFASHWSYKTAAYKEAIEFPLHEEFTHHHAAYNRSVERVSARTGALFLDNAAQLGTNPDYFTDSVHYTRAGIEVLAASYADFLQAQQIPPLLNSPAP
jgi:lysophospholipase L1-like esterase